MSRAKRIDKNQPQIVAALRKIGFCVRHTHMLGSGFPDLCIGRNGYTHLVEVKDGSQSPSLRELTPEELKFFTEFSGSKHIVESLEDVLELHKKLP